MSRATIQDLLGHGQVTTTQRYCRVSNLKVQRDYYQAIRSLRHNLSFLPLSDKNKKPHLSS